MANGDLQPVVNANQYGARSKRGGDWEIPHNNSVELRLVNRIQDGDHDAFYELVQPHQDRVYVAAFVILGNETDAEDCAEEAVLKAHKYIGQVRGDTAVWHFVHADCRK